MQLRAYPLYLWLVALPLCCALAAAVAALPWFAELPWWLSPVLVAAGLVAGLAQSLVTSRSWLLSLSLELTLLLSLGLGWLLAHVGLGPLPPNGTAAAVNVPGMLLLSVLLPPLLLLVLWLLTHPHNARYGFLPVILALAIPWIIIASSFADWRQMSAPPPAFWVLLAACSTFLVILVAYLRATLLFWRENHLREPNGTGSVLSGMVRDGMLLFLAVTCIILIPVGTQAAWGDWLPQHPFTALFGLLPQQETSGISLTQIGAPVSVRQPTPTGDAIIARYQILAGGPEPPVLATSFDTYVDGVWMQASNSTPHTEPNFGFEPGETLTRARITIVAFPQVARSFWVPAFSEPLRVSLPDTQPILEPGSAPDATALVGWTASHALLHGTSYLITSVTVPLTKGMGALPTNYQHLLTELPTADAALLQATAQRWETQGGVSYLPNLGDQVGAITNHIEHDLVYDPSAVPPGGVDPIQWWLGQGRVTLLGAATLCVQLLRAVGIPARLAQGFTAEGGIIHSNSETYWAQIAVPGLGWHDVSVFAPIRRIQTGGPSQHGTVTPQPASTATEQGTSSTQGNGTGQNPQQSTTNPASSQTPFGLPPASEALPQCLWLLLVLVALGGMACWMLRPRPLTVRTLMIVFGWYAVHIAGRRLAPSFTPHEAWQRSMSLLPPGWRAQVARYNDLYIAEVYGDQPAPSPPRGALQRFTRFVLPLAACFDRLQFWRKDR